MTELDRIAAAWDEAANRGDSGVLATVIRVEGSTYRRPGAKLLLTSGGRRVGSVSGGCLEADLVKKAWWLTSGGKAAIRSYDTSVEGEISQGFGLGCNGVIDILLERLENSTVSALQAAQPVRSFRAPAVIATVTGAVSDSALDIGQRWIRFPDGSVETNIASTELISFIQAHTAGISGSEPSHVAWNGDSQSADVFVETVTPRLRLLIFGAGDDAIPMVRQARLLGYEVVIVDGRSHLARVERFPDADGVKAMAPDQFLENTALDDWTAVILMSHSYAQDLAALAVLARGRELPYIGALGPRKRTERMLSELPGTPDWLLEVLHSPVGLDIGAEGPEQIALATVAEIQAAINRRAGGLLRRKAGPLHVAQGSIEAYTPAACALDV
jgi:xanthine dehydrogenase accessory factor